MEPIAVVTGASRGIGAASARLLGTRGWTVCVNYARDEEAARGVVEEIERAGGRALAVRADVGVREDVARLFATVEERLGRPSALVNNAGVHGPRSRLDELDPDDLDRVLAVNVTGAVLCAREAVRRMSTRYGGPGGAIVNVSSGSAYLGNPNDGIHYALSKGAVNSLTIGLAQEVAGEGIRVNAVSPGLTRTDMPSREALESAGPASIPMGRVGEPEEIAETIAWLLSPAASFVAGANLRVSGGRR